jgi:hypothetical protein
LCKDEDPTLGSAFFVLIFCMIEEAKRQDKLGEDEIVLIVLLQAKAILISIVRIDQSHMKKGQVNPEVRYVASL